MAGYEQAMTCHLGDFGEYAALRRRIGDLERQAVEGQPDPRAARADAARARRGSARRCAPHPCHGCAEREQHARWAERWWRLKQRARRALAADPQPHRARSPSGSTGSPRCSSSSATSSATGRARSCRPRRAASCKRIYGERDLLVAESPAPRHSGTGSTSPASPRWPPRSSTSRAATIAASSTGCRADGFREAFERTTDVVERARRPRARAPAAGQRPAVAGAGDRRCTRGRAAPDSDAVLARHRPRRRRLRAAREAGRRPARPDLDRRRRRARRDRARGDRRRAPRGRRVRVRRVSAVRGAGGSPRPSGRERLDAARRCCRCGRPSSSPSRADSSTTSGSRARASGRSPSSASRLALVTPHRAHVVGGVPRRARLRARVLPAARLVDLALPRARAVARARRSSSRCSSPAAPCSSRSRTAGSRGRADSRWVRLVVLPLLVAGLWCVREAATGSMPYGGFPWGRAALSQSESPFAQVVSWVGSSGLGFVMVADRRGRHRVGPPAGMARPAHRDPGRRAARRRASLAPAWQTAPAGALRVASVQGNGPSGYFDERAPGDVL